MIAERSVLEAIQHWYAANCDGDWEHSYGVQIETLDNPGWNLTVDLKFTDLEGQQRDWSLLQRSENDWIGIKVENNRFEASGGPHNLEEILQAFLDWASETQKLIARL